MMPRQDLLNAIIDDTMYDMRTSYLSPDLQIRLDGGLAGLEECRMLDDAGLLALRSSADAQLDEAMAQRRPDWLWFQWRVMQIEWVIEVMSCAYVVNGREPLGTLSIPGLNKVRDILGVRI